MHYCWLKKKQENLQSTDYFLYFKELPGRNPSRFNVLFFNKTRIGFVMHFIRTKASACFLILNVLFFFACSKDEPEACFAVSSSTAETGDTITFTNCSKNSESYEWGFGDGFTSTDEHPVHMYSDPGNYTSWLTSYSVGLESSYAEKKIAVSASREKFIGKYVVTQGCDPSQSDTIDIVENGSDYSAMYIHNMYFSLQNVSAFSNQNWLFIPQQSFIDENGDTLFIEGSGKLESITMTFFFSIEISSFPDVKDCTIFTEKFL